MITEVSLETLDPKMYTPTFDLGSFFLPKPFLCIKIETKNENKQLWHRKKTTISKNGKVPFGSVISHRPKQITFSIEEVGHSDIGRLAFLELKDFPIGITEKQVLELPVLQNIFSIFQSYAALQNGPPHLRRYRHASLPNSVQIWRSVNLGLNWLAILHNIWDTAGANSIFLSNFIFFHL